MKLNKISMAVAGGVTALGMAASMGMASAASMKPVSASTHQTGPDTTQAVTSVSSPNGPVWATDTMTKTFTAVATGGGNYTVTENVKGTFVAFSQPNNVANTVDHPLIPNVTGRFTGVNKFFVHASGLPKAAYLPKAEPLGFGTSAEINQLFGGTATDLGGQSGNFWVFTYYGPGRGNVMIQSYNTVPQVQGNITERVSSHH